jgi:site-specific recombinase XerD
VFVSSIRDCGFTDDGLKRVIRSLIEATRMKLHVHTLRHTFATLMLEGGCDIFALSRMMGHTDIKTTTIYLAASSTHLRGQIARHPLGNVRYV